MANKCIERKELRAYFFGYCTDKKQNSIIKNLNEFDIDVYILYHVDNNKLFLINTQTNEILLI